jgi:glycine cleavage system aminomethyltransferase T
MALGDFHRAQGARFEPVGGCETLRSVAGPESVRDSLSDLALADLSGLGRRSLRGADAASVLRTADYEPPERPLSARGQKEGSLLCRLVGAEYLLISDPHRADDTPAALAIAETSDCFETFYADATVDLLVIGRRSRRLLSHLTAFDLRPSTFPNLSVALTTVLTLNALIIRWDLFGLPAFRLAVDAGMATSFAEELTRLLGILGGVWVGIDVFAGLGPSAGTDR